ncbi:MAG: hypothetical protein NZ519_11880 [Bacteroidia bacterium]|nr:hypothetical protein [Bacteroidia bacterium]
MGVSLWAFRCAHAHKVGVLRATLTLRYFATHRADARPSHASRKGSLKKPFLCFLCQVLACKWLYFNLKQGKDIIA